MNSLQSALKSQGNDYVKNPHLFFNFCQKNLTAMLQEKKEHSGNNKLINQSFSRRFSSFYF